MKIKKWLLPMLILLLAYKGSAQVVGLSPREVDEKFTKSGYLGLGLRNTFSTFNGGGNYTGYGVGGHFRIPFGVRVGSEFYADFITEKIGNVGHRNDAHIGWSVMYYVINPFISSVGEAGSLMKIRLFTPFVETGHCFDYGGIYVNGNAKPSAERWSSALQAGAGTHINFSPRFDLTVKCQYMMHLGNEFHAEERNGQLFIEEHDHFNLEGHLLFTISANYKFIKLWEKKK